MRAQDEDPLETDCRMLCLQNARVTIASISEYMDNNICTRLGAWYMLYVCPFTRFAPRRKEDYL